jgi:hypothetical protein
MFVSYTLRKFKMLMRRVVLFFVPKNTSAKKLLALESLAKNKYHHKGTRGVLFTKLGIIQTSFILCIYIIITLTSSIYISYKNLEANQPKYIDAVIELLRYDSTTSNRLELTKLISNDLQEITGNIPFASNVINNLTSELFTIVDEFKSSTSFLSHYSLGETGFRNTLDNHVFTEDLEIFFSKLPGLILKLKDLNKHTIWLDILSQFIGSNKIHNLIRTLSIATQFVEQISQHSNQILKSLGHFNNQNYVLFTQNPGEARPTGGFIGSYIGIEVIKGSLRIAKSQTSANLNGGVRTNFYTHPSQYYFNISGQKSYSGSTLSTVTGNYFNCVSTSANVITKEFEDNRYGYAIDGIILVNPQSFENIVGNGLNIDIDGLNINKTNFLDEVERITSYQSTNPQNPKEKISEIFTKLLSSLSTQPKTELIVNIASEIKNRNIQTWFKNTDLNNASFDFGTTTNGSCQNSSIYDIISPIISNGSGDKRGLVTENRFNIYTKKETGTASTLHLTYQQIIPDTPLLRRGLNEVAPFTFVGLQLPEKAFDISIASDQNSQLPVNRQYINQILHEPNGQPAVFLPEYEKIMSSSFDLSGGGFMYSQPDSSKVVGMYVRDRQITTIDVEFSIPRTVNSNKIIFVGQSGLNKPSLSIGDGVYMHNREYDKFTSDINEIQAGIQLNI